MEYHNTMLMLLWDANFNRTYVNVRMSVGSTDRNALQAYKLSKRLLKNDLSYLIASPINSTSEYIHHILS